MILGLLEAEIVTTNFHYTMHEANSVAKQAAKDIEDWLRKKPETINIINVEDDPNFRNKDIDLIYKYKNKVNVEVITTIEIKGDRWHRTGNYFLETISNDQKDTRMLYVYGSRIFILLFC